MMKIYFCGSIRGGRDDAELYSQIVTFLQTYGQVLTEHVGGTSNTIEEEYKKDPKFIHDRDIEFLTQSDVIVAEVTQPSLGVGYEIGRAIDMKKPILCLFRPDSGKSLSCMIQGAHDGENFQVHHYKVPEYTEIIKKFIAERLGKT